MGFTSHYNIATMGVRAGHKLMAMMGFGFEVEIIVTPIDSGGGGGRAWTPGIPDDQQYLVTVRITRKGKKWEQSFEANIFQLKSLEKVIISFKGIASILNNIKVTLSSPIINIRRIWVNARKIK